jgi:DNA-3-methyladenine glycosylase
VHVTGDGATTAGRIVEVEAYCGPDDLAAHTAGGRRTPRNEVMWGRAGVAYVYFVYGMHWCVNVVAARAGVPEAVLIRAVAPFAGVEHMRARRGVRVRDAELGRGPGNLTRALAITREQNGADLRRSPLRLVRPDGAPAIDPASIVRSPRIGVGYAGAWASRPWRFSLRGDPSVSRPPRAARPA